YDAYRITDAELIEINPLAMTTIGDLIALDCKLTVDDSGVGRRGDLEESGVPEKLTELEARAKEHGLSYIELDGEVGMLANGAVLTMTTMDAIRHYGGEPANFLEIGGDAYTKGKPALEVVLANPKVKSLLINFCGAFARTDVMVGGLLEAWKEIKPELPVFFSIHGTGEDEAIAMVKERLGIEPFDLMDHAVEAAVQAARGEAAP
ncbi:MAG: succinate--CoA ligase, partial [Geminicoccaceae bacterium]